MAVSPTVGLPSHEALRRDLETARAALRWIRNFEPLPLAVLAKANEALIATTWLDAPPTGAPKHCDFCDAQKAVFERHVCANGIRGEACAEELWVCPDCMETQIPSGDPILCQKHWDAYCGVVYGEGE
jgi:hypothetical protein